MSQDLRECLYEMNGSDAMGAKKESEPKGSTRERASETHMHFEGVIDAPISPHDFYRFVTDPTKIISIMPDVVESRVVDDRHFIIKSKVSMFYIRGTISMDFEITETRKDTFVKMVGHGKGFQSSIEIIMAITLNKSSEGTMATWTTEAEIGGLLASLDKKILNNVAENYVKRITETLRQKVTA